VFEDDSCVCGKSYYDRGMRSNEDHMVLWMIIMEAAGTDEDHMGATYSALVLGSLSR
jgi:hypothetical protein